jgi:hypothetical protein
MSIITHKLLHGFVCNTRNTNSLVPRFQVSVTSALAQMDDYHINCCCCYYYYHTLLYLWQNIVHTWL